MRLHMMNGWSDGETTDEETGGIPREEWCPALDVDEGGGVEQALIGTGAQASAVDARKLAEMKERVSIPELPVAGLNVKRAFGAKARVRGQALLPVKIKNLVIPQHCILVQKLTA